MRLGHSPSHVRRLALLGPFALVLVVALAACSVDRAGTLSNGITTYLNSCSGAAGTTEVTWSGVNAASLRVTYRRNTTNKTTAWTAASGSSTGTAVVTVPASAATAEWAVYKVEYATGTNGSGTRSTQPIDCATAVTTTTTSTVASKPLETAPPSDSIPPQTLPVETTPPVRCTSAPSNTALPTIVNDPNSSQFLLLGNEGTWEAGPDCTITSTAYAWERDIGNRGNWSSANNAATYLFSSCAASYRIVVTKTNEFGSTSATSAVVPGRC